MVKTLCLDSLGIPPDSPSMLKLSHCLKKVERFTKLYYHSFLSSQIFSLEKCQPEIEEIELGGVFIAQHWLWACSGPEDLEERSPVVPENFHTTTNCFRRNLLSS